MQRCCAACVVRQQSTQSTRSLSVVEGDVVKGGRSSGSACSPFPGPWMFSVTVRGRFREPARLTFNCTIDRFFAPLPRSSAGTSQVAVVPASGETKMAEALWNLTHEQVRTGALTSFSGIVCVQHCKLQRVVRFDRETLLKLRSRSLPFRFSFRRVVILV